MAAISFWTYQLNNASLLIDESFNLKNISIELISGGGGFSGETTSGGIPSALVPLYVNKPVTLTSGGINNISGITISTTGVVNIVAF
jgi:hypothetical protein